MLYRDLANRSKASLWRPARIVEYAVLILTCLLAFAAAQAATFNVNSPADVPDVTPGDGKCETVVDSQVVCTLRAAVQEANALAGVDVIHLQANTTYLLTRVGIEDASLFGSLDINDSVDIVGAGPASTIVDGNGAVTNDRVFQVSNCIGGDCNLGPVVLNMTGITIRHGHTTGPGGGLLFGYFVGHPPTATLTNCRIEDNASDAEGGGIFSGGILTLTGSGIAGNTAKTGGGAYLTYENSVITDSTFSGNASAENGGGIAFGGYGSISRSTISGNHAQSEGGGIYSATFADAPHQLYIANSTISGNGSDGVGGGLKSAAGGANLFNVTVAGNMANTDASGSDGGGGGVVNAVGATLTLANSIIANNSSRITGNWFLAMNDCAGTITSQGYNIVTHPTCTILGAYSTDAVQFGPLQFNGGPTKTLALLAGSGGIDAGDPAGCHELDAILQTDQRGLPRPVGAACDLGAYEVQPDQIFQDGFDP